MDTRESIYLTDEDHTTLTRTMLTRVTSNNAPLVVEDLPIRDHEVGLVGERFRIVEVRRVGEAVVGWCEGQRIVLDVYAEDEDAGPDISPKMLINMLTDALVDARALIQTQGEAIQTVMTEQELLAELRGDENDG